MDSHMSSGSGKRAGPVMVIHGGAWTIPDSLAEASVAGVKRAARAGDALLRQGRSAMDAVEAAVTILEDDPAFDAGTGSVLNAAGEVEMDANDQYYDLTGTGSVLNAAGEVEMDAVVMDGQTLRAGGVACVSNIQHPVQLARLVMDKTDHALLVGKGANQFAQQSGVPTVDTDTLVTEAARTEWRRYMQYRETIHDLFSNRTPPSGCDTVGAVALDVTGNVAFATSTGGITAKRPGRVGDSPIVGAGGYADSQVGAVSSTGHGEAIIRTCLAHRIISLMETGQSPRDASQSALDYMAHRVQGSGGVIVVSAKGEVGVNFSTQRMAWAWVKDERLHFGLEVGQHEAEPL